MRKLLSLIFLGLLVVMTAVACNPIDEDTSGDSSENPHGKKPDFSNDKQVETGPVKLGFNFPLTGAMATFGISSRDGAQIAIDELEETGGILGRSIESTFEDNQSLPQSSANVAAKLVNQERVDVLIGAIASSNSIAMAKIADEAGVPMVTPSSTNPFVTLDDNGDVRKYIFRTCFTDDFQGEGIVDFAVNGPIGAKKAVIFYDADNDYSVGIWETIKKVAPKFGLEIVAEDAYLGTSETDYRSKLQKFKSHEFDVLIVPGYYNQVGLIANQAREVGLEMPLLGGDGFDSPELYKVAGQNIVGSYFTNHYASDDMDPAVQGFITKYKARYAKVPDAFSILAYDAVMLTAAAIERAGSTDADAIAEAIGQTTDYKGAAGRITINETHDATKKLVVLEIGDGGQKHWVYTYDPLAGEPEEESEEAVEEAVTEVEGEEAEVADAIEGEEKPEAVEETEDEGH